MCCLFQEGLNEVLTEDIVIVIVEAIYYECIAEIVF